MGRSLVAGLLLLGAAGPFDIPLRNTETAPTAKGSGRLVYAASPFGVAVTQDGVASYDVRLDLSGLPEPASLGSYSAYVAWAATSNLSKWHRLGTVRNGTTTVGQIELNKFLLVITAEADSNATARAGPTVLHGPSPSTWLQSFLNHPLFRGIPPG
jgi:hypothetical protein